MFAVIAVKLVATASVVIGVSVAVSKLGPRLGGIIAGTPIILGPGYFFMLQERPVEFIQSAALSTLHALVATLVFSICFVMTAGRMSALASLGLATLCWIPSTLVFTATPGGIWGAVLLYCLVLLVAEGIRRALGLGQPVVIARSGWFDLLLRGLLAGVLVSVATTVAARSGPLLSGVLVGFPVGLFTIGWTLHERYGSHVARATVTIAQKGMLSLVAFAVVVALVADKLPPMVTFTMSLLASLAVSAALFLVSQWQYRRADTLTPLSGEKP
ncbi:hypothetical protein GCM10011533_14610 [Streptosporangium jomthongense]|uniref:Uncharacterized protein n=1 Tax=Marinobacter aromaticivorans TaxID=1494078 RepID=A0ABW2IU18_9GAMM|nr:hypothetical protein [Marinobacter aromaticivorans]GGE63287.1 hypothetical protein GCM10011533_14610 [Streptosporangium jomthongense]